MAGIFGYDDKDKKSSEKIFKSMADLDGTEGLSGKDLEKFAELDDSQDQQDLKIKHSISKEDFTALYKKITFNPDAKVNLDELYLINDGQKYLGKSDCEEKYKKVADEIIAYAEANSDPELQKYAKVLKDLKASGNLNFVTFDGYAAIAYPENDKIDIAFNHNRHYQSKEITMQTLLHEVGHYVNGDALNSQKEEEQVDKDAIRLTKKITGAKKVFEDDENEPFKAAKKWLPLSQIQDAKLNAPVYGIVRLYASSPGYDDIPLNTGFTIPYPITKIDKEENSCTIHMKEQGFDKSKVAVEYGTEKDASGNPYPIKATYIIDFVQDGKQYHQEMSFKDYDKKLKM